LTERFCEVCNVSSKEKSVKYFSPAKMALCSKHNNQYRRYKKFMDKNKRCIFDPNEITIYEDYALIDLYDKYGNVIAQATIDVEDVQKAKLHKWRVAKKRNKLYVTTGNQDSIILYYARYILDYTDKEEVDHIDGDSLNNRKSNLRIIDRASNCLNMQLKITNVTGIRGISYDKRYEKFTIDFTIKKQRIYFKPLKIFEEAVYLRYLCEINFYKEFRNTANDEAYEEHISKLTGIQKQITYDYFTKIANKLDMKVS